MITQLRSIDRRPGRPARGEEAVRREQLLSAAFDLFLRQGFSGTSLDDISRAARVAKRTIYQRFQDKEGLFSAAIERSSAALISRFPPVRDTGGNLQADLETVGASILQFVLQPKSLAIFRLVIGEAGRHPRLARIFYEHGPGRAVASVAEVLAGHLRHRKLTEGDLVALARRFIGMVVLELHQRAVLGAPPPLNMRAVDEHVATATTAFLATLGEGPLGWRRHKRRHVDDR